MQCPFCNQEINDAAKFCNQCGKKIPRCTSCDALIQPGVKFCTECGTQVPADILSLYGTQETTSGLTQDSSVENTEDKASFCHEPDDLKEQDEEEPAEKKRKIPLPVLIVIIVLAVVIVAAVVLFASGTISFGSGGDEEEEETVSEEIEDEEPTTDEPEEVQPTEESADEEDSEEAEHIDEEEEIETISYSLSLSAVYQELEVGESMTLAVQKDPPETELNWTSSDASVVTVDNEGTVTAVGAGQCTITVTCAADRDVSQHCIIYVPEREHTYEIVMADVTWEEAEASARQAGGYLATITSEEEYEAICAVADSSENSGLRYLWLGATAGSDGWTGDDCWITGESWSFEKWYSGEPSGQDTDGTPENYLCMWQVGDTGWTFNDQRNDLISVLPSVAGAVGYVVEYD